MGFADSLLSGARLEIESTLLPKITVDLTPDKDPSNAGGVTKHILGFLKPQVSVWKGDTLVATEAHYGDPTDAPPWGLVFLGAVVVGVSLLLIARK